MPSRRVTPRRGIPQIGLPPRRGCEASRRCKWVKPDPSLLMSDALFPLASIPGLEEAPRQTPHASRLTPRLTPQTPTSPSRSFCTLAWRSHPHTDLGAQRLQLPKMRPSWPGCFVQRSASLRHAEIIISLILQHRSDFPTEEATVNSVVLLFAKRFGVLTPDS
jgi:hypothetical protein